MTKPPTLGHCDTCLSYDPVARECHFNPPVQGTVPHTNGATEAQWHWPQCGPADWCRKWESAT